MKKIINLDEGEASVTIPENLSVDSYEKLEQWMTSLLRKTRGQTTIRQTLAKLQSSMVAHVANDDESMK